jgi:hypothetical protein
MVSRKPTSDELWEKAYRRAGALGSDEVAPLVASSRLKGSESFKALMHIASGLDEQRASLLAAVVSNSPLDRVALLRHWLDVHALGHLAVCAFVGDATWFADMVAEVRPRTWTPSFALTRERIMGVALRGAWAAARLGAIGVDLYASALRRPAQPLEHFDAVLALAAIAQRDSSVVGLIRLELDQWAARARAQGGDVAALRRALVNCVTWLLDDPTGAREWSLAWCRSRVAATLGADSLSDSALASAASSFALSVDELLVLFGINDVVDCGTLVNERIAPAILLLSQVGQREAIELYFSPHAAAVLSTPWTPDLGIDVLRRSIAVAPVLAG